jgi:sporulation protein YlmC with PRC-barrel domain
MDMLIEATDLLDKTVITDKGKELGIVSNLIIDVKTHTLYELLVDDTNEEIVENAVPVGVPFRWIHSISDHIVLKYFPGKIRLRAIPKEPTGKRKLRVVKKKWGDHGVSRLEWR